MQAQSDAFREVYDQLPDENKFFFYPSTLRTLIGDNQPFLDFVKDVKNLKLLIINSSDEIAKNLSIKNFNQTIQAEGFAELMTIKEGQSQVTVLENNETILALLNSSDKVAMIEMVGKVDMAAVMKMLREGELPLNEFQDFFKQEIKKEKPARDDQNNEQSNN